VKRLGLYMWTLVLPLLGHSQAVHQLEHTVGTEKIQGVKVTVTSSGTVATNTTYCQDSQPYHIGGDEVKKGDGNYTFEFSPAVSEVMLNFSALSASNDVYGEIVILKVNGVHYEVPEAGEKNNCDELAIITPEGNIAPCHGCYGAGFNGLIIQGPISKLEVKDSCLFGSPAGTLFSLFISDAQKENKEIKSVRALRLLKIVNDRNHVKVIGIPSKTAELLVFDEDGNEIKRMTQDVKNGQLIDVSKLKSGYYVFVLKSAAFREERSIILE
jgi:hypothetical protein